MCRECRCGQGKRKTKEIAKISILAVSRVIPGSNDCYVEGGDDARVEKNIVENDVAVGIRLADGGEYRADWVVSAADERTTIFDMLEGKFIDDEIKNRYENPCPFQPFVYVGLGVAREFEDLPASIGGLTYPLDRPITIAGKEEKIKTVRSYSFYPTTASKGKDVLIVQCETDYDFWKNLGEDPERYKDEKERITADVVTGRV